MGLFPTFQTWFMENHTTFQVVQGQFEPVNLTHNIKPNWAGHTALSRQNEILQFLNMGADTLQFGVVLHNYDSITGKVEEDYELISSWARPDALYGNRPPTLTFWVGSGWSMMDCIVDGVSDAVFGRPTVLGDIREVKFTVSLRAYKEFSLESKSTFETRYHRSVVRDYYELLSYREYRSPLLGDVIRKRHPTKPNVQKGDVIKLPSVEAIRKEQIETKSLPLKTAYGKKPTPQRSLRLEMFEKRNRTYVSHVLIAD